MGSLQLNLNVISKEELRHAWAFAVDRSSRYPRRRRRTLNTCVITSASREARSLGVRAGMLCADAKLLLPDLKVLVYNWR